MAVSIDPLTFIIFIPKADLTLVGGTLYELDTNAFRLELKGLEDDEQGIVMLKTHNHNTEYTVASVTYARSIQILTPYMVEFEDGMYTVRLVGSNNNIFDVGNGVLVQNMVQVIPGNSAGLITVATGRTQLTVREDELAVGGGQVGGTSWITLNTAASPVDNTYVGTKIVLTAGTGVGQSAIITRYIGALRRAIIKPKEWSTVPDATTVYTILP